MQCPFCGNYTTRTIDSRVSPQGRNRQRRCGSCGNKFSTVETVAAEDLIVRKRDGRVEPFSRAKLASGIAKAASVHAIAPGAVDVFVGRVLRALGPTAPGAPIPSVEIGRTVLEELQDGSVGTDIARIRFAIVFLGRTTRASGFRSLPGFLQWLEANYGPQMATHEGPYPSTVIKRRGAAVPFDMKKLERSIGIAAKGRGDDSVVHQTARTIAQSARESLRGQAFVTSQQIAAAVLTRLAEEDDLAYLRYASAVKRYRSVSDFWLEADALKALPRRTRRTYSPRD